MNDFFTINEMVKDFNANPKMIFRFKRLQVMSKKTRLTASELVRPAIDEYWERFERKEKRK
jgi:hypothetical protein